MSLTLDQIKGRSEFRMLAIYGRQSHPYRQMIHPEVSVRIVENGLIVHAGQFDSATRKVHITEYGSWWELDRLELAL